MCVCVCVCNWRKWLQRSKQHNLLLTYFNYSCSPHSFSLSLSLSLFLFLFLSLFLSLPFLSILDSSFVLTYYKTDPCKRPPRLCRQGYACPFYHNNKDRRRSPKTFKYRCSREWGGVEGRREGGDRDRERGRETQRERQRVRDVMSIIIIHMYM